MSPHVATPLVASIRDPLYNVLYGPRGCVARYRCPRHCSYPFRKFLCPNSDIEILNTFYLQIFWNIFLMCLGRHPLQNPHMIKPEIGGLPKSVVERIPLVMYIPSPPEDEKNDIPSIPHIYPPKTIEEPKPPQQKRFKLLRRFRSKRSKQSDNLDIEKDESSTTKEDAGVHEDEPISWEDNWERSDYPFVALEGNRAACAICLLDFEAPKRKHPLPAENETGAETEVSTATEVDNAPPGSSTLTQSQSPNIHEENRPEALKLEDAGEGAQPLRLLECGHVFHVSTFLYTRAYSHTTYRAENLSRPVAYRRLRPLSNMSASSGSPETHEEIATTGHLI